MNRLKDKVCIITGAAQGIGESMARLFFSEGAKVVIADIQEEKAQKVARSLKNNDSVLSTYLDIREEKTIKEMVKKTLAKFGQVDVLVNNAAKDFHYDPLKITSAEWNACLHYGLTGTWNCSREVLSFMLNQGHGNIINIASVHGKKIIGGYFPYAIIKHGVLGLTKALAIEYADKNIRVNAIAPGFIETPATEKFLAGFSDPKAAREREMNALPQKRLGKPIEVAYTALFLASDEAPFINAECVMVDSGRSVVYNDLVGMIK